MFTVRSAQQIFREGLGPIGQFVWDYHCDSSCRLYWAQRWLQGETLWNLQRDFCLYVVSSYTEDLVSAFSESPIALV